MADEAVHTLPPWPYPLRIAHRGAGKQAPENTLAAFRVGAAHGYRMFECDVKLSADGVPFLLHDATLERTTNGSGMAGEHAWADVSRLDAGSWHSRVYAGEPPASLAAVAGFCVHNGFALNIEIKPTPGHELETGRVVAAAAASLFAAGALPPLLSSFSVQALQGAQQAGALLPSHLPSHLPSDLPRALLLDALWPGWLDAVRSLGCVAVVAQHRLLDATLMRQLHDAGLHALAYTVNDGAEALRLTRLGVRGIVSDEMGQNAGICANEITNNISR